MASTDMLTSSSNAVKVWEMKTWLQAMKRSVVGHMFNRGVIHVPDELNGKNSVGDTINFDFVGNLTDVPKGEGDVLDGNEEALDIQAHSMVMNMSRLGVLSPNKGTIEQQRTNIAFDKVSQDRMALRTRALIDASAFMQLAGADPTSVTLDQTTYATAAQKKHIQGHNTIVAPTTNRILRAGSQASDQALTSADKFTLKLIDYALEMADVASQPLEPLGDDTFDLYVSPEQLVDLQHDTTSPVQWYTNELAKIQGGSESFIDNPFKNNIRCAGKYQNVWIYSAPRVAYGVNGSTSANISTVRRAVLVGSNALSFASPFGSLKSDSGVPVKYFEQLKDYGAKKGSEARLLYGLKKMSPSNKDDIGVITISTYAAAHT